MNTTKRTTRAPSSATPGTLILERPEDISDARWETLQAKVHLIVTGHAPWCQDHRNVDEDGGYCLYTQRSFCATVELSNSSIDGSVNLALYLDDGVNEDELTISQAAAIGSTLEAAAEVARLGNFMAGSEYGQ